MHCPHLKPGKQILQNQDLFYGLNRNLRLRPGEFYDMENLTSELAPVMSPRVPRGIVSRGKAIHGMIQRDGLCYVEGRNLVINGYSLDLGLSESEGDCPKQLVSMGAYLLILPDKVYVNTADYQDRGRIEAETVTAGTVNLTQCSLDGSEIRPAYVSAQTPKEPGDRMYWLDTGEKKLKQYSAAAGLWVVLETPLVKLHCPGVGGAFSAYDGVTLAGLPENELWNLNGAAILYGAEPDSILFPGLLEGPVVLEAPVTVARKMPRMDFVVESGNRLWGCRYGPDAQGRVVNELYCSKLGDFRNWSCYLGISTDSYRVSLGSDGPFTGAAVLGGHPLFFKEKCIHKVFGQFPANFQVQTSACQGVGKGCGSSLAQVGELLYYKGSQGIFAYDGAVPVEISQNLGLTRYGRAVGAAMGSKYYVSLEKESGGWELLVYDADRQLWHREDSLEARFLCGCKEDLFCFDSEGRLLSMLGKAGEPEGPVQWMAESGIVGIAQPGNRYLTKLCLRMQLEPGSRVSAQVQYDSCGIWETVGTVEGMSLRSFTLPILPRRCDHFRLRLQGMGKARVFAVTRMLSPGGEL